MLKLHPFPLEHKQPVLHPQAGVSFSEGDEAEETIQANTLGILLKNSMLPSCSTHHLLVSPYMLRAYNQLLVLYS